MSSDFKSVIEYHKKYLERAHEVVRQIKKFAEKEVEKSNAASDKEFNEYQKNRIVDMFNQAVDEFYGDYTPKFYKRKGSVSSHSGGLYDILDMRTDEDGMVIAEEPNYDELYDKNGVRGRVGSYGSPSLFDSVFKTGYHGGSTFINADSVPFWGAHPSPRTPYWRRPGFCIDPRTEMRSWFTYGAWGRAAAVAEMSPYDRVAQLITEADSDGGEFDEMWEAICDKYDETLGNTIQSKLNAMMREL